MTTKNSISEEVESSFRAIYEPDYEKLKMLVEDYRKQGKKIVLTQGSWDMLHIGHVFYMEKARTFGDVLIVGVDSDMLIKKEKGPNRPVYPEIERVPIIRFLRQVDIVTLRYAEDKVGDLVRVVRPDVFVISETTTERNPNIVNEMLEEHKGVCGDIQVLKAQAQTSTSAKIRLLIVEGVTKLKAELIQAIDHFTANFKF
jgi:D-beta-D-heptose 7-phosphate kinase/D-beta-D-heptose 1-phosphate adenosyltransferase